jgi:hypothetical protein
VNLYIRFEREMDEKFTKIGYKKQGMFSNQKKTLGFRF